MLSDANYTQLTSEPNVQAGMCGWTSGIAYRGDDQNTEFDALQVTLAKQFSKGLAVTGNYQWDAAFDEQSGYYTWDHQVTHGRDSNTRTQQLTAYGSYDFPFGRGKQFAPNANRVEDLLIGGYQLSSVLNWAGGLPYTLNYGEASANIPGSAPTYPSAVAGRHMKTNLGGFNAGAKHRKFYDQQIPGEAHRSGGCRSWNGGLCRPGPRIPSVTSAATPTSGLDSSIRTLEVTKAFTIRESIVTKFRVDAFNAFNHINPGNPGGGIELGRRHHRYGPSSLATSARILVSAFSSNFGEEPQHNYEGSFGSLPTFSFGLAFKSCAQSHSLSATSAVNFDQQTFHGSRSLHTSFRCRTHQSEPCPVRARIFS